MNPIPTLRTQSSSDGVPGRRGVWSARRGCAVAAALALFVVALYAEENWRGKQAWLVYQRALVSKGIRFDWRALAPPRVADDQDLGRTPFFAALYDYLPGTHTPRDLAAYNKTAGFAQTGAPYEDQRRNSDALLPMSTSARTDLIAGLHEVVARNRLKEVIPAQTQASPRSASAAAVIRELAVFDPVINELRAATRGSLVRFKINCDEDKPWQVSLPHVPVLKRVNTVLALRASASLAAGDAASASDDVDLMIRLADSIQDEPFWNAVAARYAMLAQVSQVIWEGLADHHWSVAQLDEFEARLGRISPVAEARGLVRIEEIGVNEFFGDLHREPSIPKRWRLGPGFQNRVLPYFLWLMPEGWMYREQMSYHRSIEERLLPGLDFERGTVQPWSIHQAADGKHPWWKHRLLSNLLMASMDRLLLKAAQAQTVNNQTIIACALERYRDANNQFPEALALLTPQYLAVMPLDVTTGLPMIYRCPAGDRFQLYSIGWNGKDDGGKVVKAPDGKTSDLRQGDWVWPQYPQE